MCLTILGHYALKDLYFSSFLSSPSNETLTDVPTSSSISVHCELAEPEENDDMYWYIPLDVSTDDEVYQSESYTDVNSDKRYHDSSQFENNFPWFLLFACSTLVGCERFAKNIRTMQVLQEVLFQFALVLIRKIQHTC